MGKLLERATEARDYISDPANWLQGDLCYPDPPSGTAIERCKAAEKVCSVGAMFRFDLVNHFEGGAVYSLAQSLAKDRGTIVQDLNDYYTHAEVMDFWDDLLLKVKEYEDAGEIATG